MARPTFERVRPRVVGVAGALGFLLLLTGFSGAQTTRLRGRIVFAAGQLGGTHDIYTVNANGSRFRQLTDDPITDQSPTWSADGNSITYVRYPGYPSEGALYEIRARGGRPHLLFRETKAAKGIISDPVWSRDGRRLAFASARSGGYEIWTYARNGTLNQVTREGPKGFAVHPSWSPDGKRLAYGGPGAIFVIRADGTGRREAARGPVEYDSPVWSPNGKWIAVRSLNAGWQKHESDSLVIVNAASATRRTLARGGVIFPMAWSPDGDAILFVQGTPPPNTSSQLYIVALAGAKPRPVPGTQGAGGGASWHR